jgi:UDPglucose 6-dehydrogenase
MTKPVIGFAGMTHLGINSAAAALGHGFDAVCYDPDQNVIERLKAGDLPVVESGLPELLQQHAAHVLYTDQVSHLTRCSVIYIAADVPTDDAGQSELSGIRALIGNVAVARAEDATLVVTRGLDLPHRYLYYQVETLVFGQAVERAMHPERFIIGCAEPGTALPDAYRQFLKSFACPLLPMRYESAELAKIAINCCLVSSVTVANTLAELSERIGANWHEIVPALKLDRRIGQYAYLSPGLGLAGGNLERDLVTVLRLAGETGSEAGLIQSFVDNSRHRKDWVLRTLHREVFARNLYVTITILGLAYKENTHSTKNSPSLALIQHLKSWSLRVHDPVVSAQVVDHPKVTAGASALDAAAQADVLVVMTPWPVYRDLKAADLARVMQGRIIIDPYRVFDGGTLAAAGFQYFTLGVM